MRGHWAIVNWVRDLTFKGGQSRLRRGHGVKNIVIVRHFAINLRRAATVKRSINLRRRRAGWDPEYRAALPCPAAFRVNPHSEPRTRIAGRRGFGCKQLN